VNYLGNFINHVWWSDQINPAVYGPGATLANLNQRRVLFLQNPAEGQYYASVQEVRTDGTSSYHGLMLQMQSRRTAGFSLQAAYTFSRCLTDRWNSGPGVDGFSVMIPGNREADRAKCANSSDHNLNSSIVYQVPGAGRGVVHALTSGWQTSAILSARSGGYYTVNIGSDVALSGQCCGASGAPQQRANQVLADPYMPDRTYAQWLNPAAFQRPAEGTYGTMPLDALQAVARWNVDLGVSRSIGFARNTRQIQLRLEAFNLFNTVTPGNPQTTLTSSDFGKVTSLAAGTAPRVMQLAIKYQF
jgi:hypothetical protein